MVIITVEPPVEADPEPDIGGSPRTTHHDYHQQTHLSPDEGDVTAADRIGSHHEARVMPYKTEVSFEPPSVSAQSPTKEKEVKPKVLEPSWMQCVKNTLRASPFLMLLPILLPLSWSLHFTHQSPVAVFVTSLICIVPLAGGLSFATEEIAHRVGDAWGGLLNASFGNAVELLIAILALIKGDIDIVQASMIGSILSNVLLVLGMSYFAGGLRFHEQLYGIVGAQMHISLLGISLTAIVLPAAYHYAFPSTSSIVDNTIRPGRDVPYGDELDSLLKLSRGLSFVLLAVYGMFLCFQLWTHAYLFQIPREALSHPLPGPQPDHERVFPRPHWVPSADSDASSTASSSTGGPIRRLRRWSVAGTASEHDVPIDIERQIPPRQVINAYHPEPKVKLYFALGLLCLMTALAGVTAEWLVESIDGLTATGNVSREFVGLILLPVIGNSVEHITAVTVSVKDKLNLSMSIAVGSSIQVSLCLLPILVLIGWAIGQPMLLFFDTFETITLVISVLLVNFAISDGRTNYLEGFVMMMAYLSIALVCWFYDPVV